jgi:type I restriction enzyme M protein
MNVSAVIKSIRNIMRQDKGVNGDAQRLEQMGWMLFLKIFDAKDEEMDDMDETGHYVSPIPKEYQWRSWAANDEGITGDELITFIDRKLFPDLSNLKIQDNKRAVLVRDVFRGNNNYMKSGQLFRQVVNELNKIDFHASKDRHVFGQVYETILKELQSAGSSGEFYTPRAVTEFMTHTIEPKLGERILDPACGTGGFLTAAIEHIRKSGVENLEQRRQLQNSVHGFELKPLPHMLAVTNLILHDIEVPDITYDDALLQNQSIKPKNRVDVILANPPFGGNVDDATAATFPIGFRTKESADLFLVMMVNYLKQGGRAAIVLPDGSLTGDGIKARIREMLLRNCNLHTIIRLPNSVFKPYASVSTNLLFFERVSSPSEEQEEFATKEIWYYEHQLPEGSKAYSMTNPIKLEEFEAEKAWWKNRTESETVWKTNLSEIIEKAIENAKPHYEKEKELKREAYNLKEKISTEKHVLKDIDKAQKAKIEKQQEKIKALETALQNNDARARIEKQTAESIYYAAFDLDIKNPNKVEEDLGDPNKLIYKQDTINGQINSLLNDIELKLKPALQDSAFEILLTDFKRFIQTNSNALLLRQTILQLAIQGKLTVEWRNENTNIESTEILLNKIKIERDHLINKKILRREKPLPPIEEYEKSFVLPDNWSWTRIGITHYLLTGATPSTSIPEYWNGDIKWLKSGDVNKGVIKECDGRITEKGLKNSNCKILPIDSVLIALNGQGKTRGTSAILRIEAACNQSLVAIIPVLQNSIMPEFLHYFLSANYMKIRNITGHDKRTGLNMPIISNLVFVIPPFEEQKEIIKQANQLLVLCDELEKKIGKRDSFQEIIMQAIIKQAFTVKNETIKI